MSYSQAYIKERALERRLALFRVQAEYFTACLSWETRPDKRRTLQRKLAFCVRALKNRGGL